MKRIIDGKLYNTETATKICNDSYGYSGDFKYFDEDLYVTKNGNYFLAGEGGAASKYGKATGQGETSGSVGIFALSKQEAFEFCQRVDSEACLQFFADMIEEA